MQIENRSIKNISKFTAVFMGLTFSGLVYAVSLNYAITFASVPFLIYGTYRFIMKKTYRRAKIVKEPFPPSWKTILENKVDFYQHLEAYEKEHFEKLVQVFLKEQRIFGVKPVEIDDEIRLMVAAGAISLVFYRPEWEFRNFRDILVYEDAFDMENFEISKEKNILGMVGTQMPIILSLKHLKAGFRHGGDGFNLAYHEFAHIIDLHDVGSQNNPLHGIFARALILSEMKKIRAGKSVLRAYGAFNESEFFAVASEFFFERPDILSEHHPELFRSLSDVYNFNPLKVVH